MTRFFVDAFHKVKGKWRMVFATSDEADIEPMLQVYKEQNIETRIRKVDRADG